MRSTLLWSEVPGKAVGLWGLGVEGQASLRKLAALGVTPILVDDHPGSAEMGGLPVAATANGGLELLLQCDAVIKSPGISRYCPAAEQLTAAGVPLVGGLGMWLQEAPRDRVVCVTGTKGKSTTTSIIDHLLRGLGYRCFLGGNFGLPPYDPDAPSDADYWVIETSSYQATDVATSPGLVAVTSLHPDHLPWHGSVERYYSDKLSLCSQTGARLTIANGQDPLLRARSAELGPRVRWIEDRTGQAPWLDGLPLPGRHNRINALIAVACLRELGVEASDHDLGDLLPGVPLLSSRLETIDSIGAVSFVDDSLSTNVLSTTSALDVYPDRKVALLVGGHDRGIDYTELAEYLARRSAETLVLTLPETGRQVAEAMAAQKGPGRAETESCPDLEVAVERGFRWARPDGVVLLSPAAASFGGYRDFRHRSKVFAAAVHRCRELSAER